MGSRRERWEKEERMEEENEGEIQKLIEKTILNPSQKISCVSCRRDINSVPKIIDSLRNYYCCPCFSNLDPPPSDYRVLNQLNYPLFTKDWTAKEELLLFEGISKHGFGNWAEISDHIKTKGREEVEDHYLQTYLNSSQFLPTEDILTRKNHSGILIYKSPPPKALRQESQITNPITNSATAAKRASTGNKVINKIGKNPHEIIGYLPRRGDFEIQYDNDAQFLLAQMEFNDEDQLEERQMKFRLIDIYNHKLNERISRKEFVISRKLLDSREQVRLDKTRTKEEKEIYNMMKVFARFNCCEEHERLVQNIIKEKHIRQRIEQLKQLKRRGVKTFGEVEDELDKKKKEDKSKKRETEYNDKMRRVRKDNVQEKTEKKVTYINKEEEDLCRYLNMTFKQFASMKERILKESVRIGLIKSQDIMILFEQEDRGIVCAVFDFLLRHEDIMVNQNSQLGIE